MDWLVQLVHPGAKIPTLGSSQAGGWDFYVPEDTILVPGINKIDLGLKMAIEVGYRLCLCDRSSLGAKGLHVFAGLIDSDYRGKVMVVVFNTNLVPYPLVSGDRICQGKLEMVPKTSPVVSDSLPEPNSTRVGGFGSTGA